MPFYFLSKDINDLTNPALLYLFSYFPNDSFQLLVIIFYLGYDFVLPAGFVEIFFLVLYVEKFIINDIVVKVFEASLQSHQPQGVNQMLEFFVGYIVDYRFQITVGKAFKVVLVDASISGIVGGDC